MGSLEKFRKDLDGFINSIHVPFQSPSYHEGNVGKFLNWDFIVQFPIAILLLVVSIICFKYVFLTSYAKCSQITGYTIESVWTSKFKVFIMMCLLNVITCLFWMLGPVGGLTMWISPYLYLAIVGFTFVFSPLILMAA